MKKSSIFYLFSLNAISLIILLGIEYLLFYRKVEEHENDYIYGMSMSLVTIFFLFVALMCMLFIFQTSFYGIKYSLKKASDNIKIKRFSYGGLSLFFLITFIYVLVRLIMFLTRFFI